MKGLFVHILPIFILLQYSCNQSLKKSEIYAWLNDMDHGLVKTRVVKDLEITVKYLPPAVQALNDLEEGMNQSKFDSLESEYSNQLSFIISFKSTLEGKDILYKGVEDNADFNQRVLDLSFNISSLVYLELADGQSVNPKLAHLERAYGTTKSNKVYLVFSDVLGSKNEKLTLVFVDKIFGSGISKYKFLIDDIRNVPKLTI